MLDTLVIHCT